MCKRCGSKLSLNGYCNNYKCPYSDWPQSIKLTDLILMSVKNVELKYNIKKRPQCDDNKLTGNIQNWNKSKKIMLLESFINSYGLERELIVYLQKVAEREDSNKQSLIRSSSTNLSAISC